MKQSDSRPWHSLLTKMQRVFFESFVERITPLLFSFFSFQSFGGFLTTYVLSKNTGVFIGGIAVAPVTDWRYYGERLR